MNLFTKIRHSLCKYRLSCRQYWIKRFLSKKLDLNTNQKKNLQQLIEKILSSKNDLNNSLNSGLIKEILGQQEFNLDLARTKLNQDVKAEFEKILYLIADYYNQLEDNQKQKLRQLIDNFQHQGCHYCYR